MVKLSAGLVQCERVITMTLKTLSEFLDLAWFHLIDFQYFQSEEISIWVATGTLQ
jgi:hypothetical protein